MVTKTYNKNNAVELTTDMWANFNTKQKTDLLRSRKLNTSWAVTKTIPEMVQRGGGMVANNLLDLNKKYLDKHKSKTITWKY